MDRVSFYLKESFEKNHLSNFGPAYQLLVEKLKEFLQLDSSKDLLLTTSGHTALMAAYGAFNLGCITLPSYTFKSTENAATLQGIAIQHLEPNEKTGCIDRVPLGFFEMKKAGYVAVCALSTIPDLKSLHYAIGPSINKPKLIIDGAASFGTPDIYNQGDAFCLSFHATKTMPIGECGALIASKEVIAKAKQFINFGFDKDRNPVMPGMNAKVSDYTCAIGLALLEKMPEAIQKRNQFRDIYLKELSSMIPKSYHDNTTYQAMPIFAWNDFTHAKRIRAKLKEANIEFLQYYRPLITTHPTTDMLYQTNICLPCHQDLTSEEVEFICKKVKSA